MAGKGSFNLDDYIDVAERTRIFREQYPNGSLQARVIRWPYEGPIAQALQFIAVEARAYRTPDDERPGFGLAWEPFPGRTPYTKDSELMVAETSAWGRAIVAVLAADTKRGVASKNEVRNRRPHLDAGMGVLPDESPFPVGSSTTWDEINVKASGERVDDGTKGKEAEVQSSPESSGEEEGRSPSLDDAETSSPGPTSELEELWAEALSRDFTRARVVSILRKAQQPVNRWEDVDARQLRSILGPLQEQASGLVR